MQTTSLKDRQSMRSGASNFERGASVKDYDLPMTIRSVSLSKKPSKINISGQHTHYVGKSQTYKLHREQDDLQ